MDLSHTFTVPTPVEVAWEHFGDIGALAECFPGAQVTSVGTTDDGLPTFEGSCKVKLGPIALVYTGAGAFVERDAAGRRFVVEAKGRDKRGNGTAGATVTVTMRPATGPTTGAATGAGEATEVEVLTDLAITGKPAQFGRGVLQDVSDKLLGQFVACLEHRLAVSREGAGSPPRTGTVPPSNGHGVTEAGISLPPHGANPALSGGEPRRFAENDDALDLGSAVLPVLLRSYGRQVGAGAACLLAVLLLRRLLRR